MQSAPSDMSCAEFGKFLARYGAPMTRQAVRQSQVIPKRLVGGKPRVPVAEALTALQAAGRISLEAEAAAVEVPQRPDAFEDEALRGRPKAGGGSYYDEKALTERVTREIQEIKLAQMRGELVRTADVAEALTDAGRRIGEQMDQLAGMAGEIAAVAREGGEAAVREVLRTKIRALRDSMGDALARAMGGDAEDEEGEGDEPA